MKHRSILIGACLVAGCTYKTYKTYNEAPIEAADDDAGVQQSVGTGGGAGAGGGNGAAGTGGDGGSAEVGSAGSTGLADSLACTGCVRLSVVPGRGAEYQRELEPRLDLSNSLVLWRVRVRDFVGDVGLVAYVESGDHVPDQGFNLEASRSAVVTLNATAGWQDFGIDLRSVDPFSEPVELGDAGGTRPGFPFDKSRVERIGMQVFPLSQLGLFTPATVELDAVTFSPQQSLDLGFSSDQGGFELFDPESASITFVPG